VDVPPEPVDIPSLSQDPLIDMVPLPGGRFWMGSPVWHRSAYDDERPRHRVTLSPFLISRTAVTRGLWRRVMAGAPEHLQTQEPRGWERGEDDLPADLDWYAALAFCNALSLHAGRWPCYRQLDGDWCCDWEADGYRLPTEAEWEYACRGGRRSPWHWGHWAWSAGYYAWYSANAGMRLYPVGQKDPNPFGLSDMAGNCWEWCWDRYGAYQGGPVEDPRGAVEGHDRVLRGGSHTMGHRGLRSANRLRSTPSRRLGDYGYFGFRCVRSGAPASCPLVRLNPWNPLTWPRVLFRGVGTCGPWMARRRG